MNDKHGTGNDETLEGQMDRLVDRFVDGELSDAEQRDLLATLDTTDEGWRKLALAYVEAQTWGDEFGTLVAPAVPTGLAAPVAEPAKTASLAPSSQTLKLVLAMAASFLVALVIGRQFRGEDDTPGQPTLTSFVEAPATDGGEPALVHSAIPIESTTDANLLAAPVVPNGPNAVPIFSVGSEPGQVGASPAIPSNIEDLLRRLRHRVIRRRSLVPVEGEDGRPVLVPVEDIEVEYLGDEAYQ